MGRTARPSPIEHACAALRTRALEVEEGTLLGSEDQLHTGFGISRSTMRQAARIVETEGLLTVRRGAGGGYFAARPKLSIIENAVSAYLVTRAVAPRDALVVSGLIWPEAVRRAARARPDPADVKKIERMVERVDEGISFEAFAALEMDVTRAIMRLACSDFIEFILDLNLSFFRVSGLLGANPITADFLESWKAGRRMEFTAIRTGDEELAQFAGTRLRALVHEWLAPVLSAQADPVG